LSVKLNSSSPLPVSSRYPPSPGKLAAKSTTTFGVIVPLTELYSTLMSDA